MPARIGQLIFTGRLAAVEKKSQVLATISKSSHIQVTRAPRSALPVVSSKELPLIEGRDRQQIFQRDAAEIPRWSEASRSWLQAASPLVVRQIRVREDAGACEIRGRKTGRPSGDRGAGRGRRIDGWRAVLGQERVDVLRVDHQDGGVLYVRLPRGVQLDQHAACYPVEQRQTKHRGWEKRKKIEFVRASLFLPLV